MREQLSRGFIDVRFAKGGPPPVRGYEPRRASMCANGGDRFEGPSNGWSTDYAIAIRAEYQRYFAMNVVFVDEEMAPSHQVDEYWHAHILDTEAYNRDCQTVAGRFVHHFPYFGLRGADDAAALDASFQRTQEIYRELFGVEVPGIWFVCEGSNLSRHPKPGPSKCRPGVCSSSSCK